MGWNRIKNFWSNIKNLIVGLDRCQFAIKHDLCKIQKKRKCTANHHTTCDIYKNHKDLKDRDKTSHRVLIAILLGVLFIIVGVLPFDLFFAEKKDILDFITKYIKPIQSVVLSFGVSIIAGAVITIVIDLPSKLKEYEVSFLNALSSNTYVESLNHSQLEQLRHDTTVALNTKNTNNVAEGLITLDEKICNLLSSVYCSRYRDVMNYRKTDDPNIFIKHDSIEYTLVNPLDHDISETFLLKKMIKRKNCSDKISEYISDIRLCVRKDDEEPIYVDVEMRDSSVEHGYYNTKVELYEKGKDEQGYKISFTDKVIIKVECNVKIPKEDICFTRRVKYPTKDFRVDFIHESDNIQLLAQLFGAYIKQSDITTYISGKSIGVETSGWLLPQDGAVIVLVQNEK